MDGLSVTNVYDSLLRRTNVSAIGSSALSSAAYVHDAASRLSMATNESGGDWAAYAYLANSPLVSQIVFKQVAMTAPRRRYPITTISLSRQQTGCCGSYFWETTLGRPAPSQVRGKLPKKKAGQIKCTLFP